MKTSQRFFAFALTLLAVSWPGQTAAQVETYDPEARLAALGIELPEPPSPVANYVNGELFGRVCDESYFCF